MPPSLLTFGRCLEVLQMTPTAFQAAAASLKIAPVVLVDGCGLYHELDVEKIGKHLRPPPPAKPPVFEKTIVMETVKDGEVVSRQTITKPVRAPRPTTEV